MYRSGSRRASRAPPRDCPTPTGTEQLYNFVDDLGASVIVAATHSRYVVDLNRPPDNANLYPGQDTTGVVPVDTFDKAPLYLRGFEPSHAEVRSRIEQYLKPYHAKLAQELKRIKGEHGALLWDVHSILSVVPRFFEGKLPDFNLKAGWQFLRKGARRGVAREDLGVQSAERPLQGRLHHAHLRRSVERYPRGPARAIRGRLHRRAAALPLPRTPGGEGPPGAQVATEEMPVTHKPDAGIGADRIGELGRASHFPQRDVGALSHLERSVRCFDA